MFQIPAVQETKTKPMQHLHRSARHLYVSGIDQTTPIDKQETYGIDKSQKRQQLTGNVNHVAGQRQWRSAYLQQAHVKTASKNS